MNNKAFAISVALLVMLCFGSTSVFAANGPKTAGMQIHVYLHPDPCNADLELGILDINDWPLAKEWIDEWALMPTQLTLRDYVDLGMYEVDINNQRWPTGCDEHKFYTSGHVKCDKSVLFRKAIACLLDRDAIVTEVLKGYGYRLDVPVPPPQSAYMDMPLYRSLGLVYDYNVTRAEQFLDTAGFTRPSPTAYRIDPLTGTTMAALKFYIRMDDPKRMRAGQMLTAELEAVGVPVNAIITERTVCFNQVMVIYDYHLYTGGWSLSTIPDTYYDLYSSYTYYGPDMGWSLNYAGFCNYAFDAWATQVKYPATVEDAQAAAKEAGKLFLQYCAIVPMWSAAAVKAYKTGWTGVVNNALFGIDNGYTFMNMYKAGDAVIDWGFKSDIEQLNMISSEWLWDHNVLGLIYDSMIGTNPFNAAPTEFWLASAYVGTTWDASVINPLYDTDATHQVWTIRSGVTWHDGSAFTRDDVKFTLDFMIACGPGIAWGFTSVDDVYDVTLGPGADQLTVRMKHKSAWSFQWIGGSPIIKKGIWELIKDGTGKTWTVPGFNFLAIRQYDPATDDANANTIVDLKEDGTGPWKYNTYVFGEYVTLDAYTGFYFTQTYIEDRLKDMFHFGAGDANEDGVVNIVDIGWFTYAFGTSGNPAAPPLTPPIPYNVYNSACDITGPAGIPDGLVNILDLNVAGRNYGSVMG